MLIKRIADEKDYAKAVQRVEQLLFNSTPDSPEWAELMQLSKLVEKYENENYIYIDPTQRVTPNPVFDLDRKITDSHMKKKYKE